MSLKVFISGATGFVGRHLIDFLGSAKFEIYGAYFPDKPEKEFLDSHKNIFYLDMKSEKLVFKAIKETRPDWIFHLAAVSNVKHSWERREETLETNIMGTFYLLEAIRTFTPRSRMLFISSSDVYQSDISIKRPLKETDSKHVMSPYAFTKLSGEILCQLYAEVEKLDIVIARPFPHTGPGQSSDFVCSDWACQITQIEKGITEPVMQVGNLKVKRDFSDVRDVVRAYVLLVEKGRRGEVYNICSGKAVPLRQILKLLLSFSTKTIEIRVDPSKLRKADIPLLVGDNRKIKRQISWRPKISLNKTLFDLLGYWRKK